MTILTTDEFSITYDLNGVTSETCDNEVANSPFNNACDYPAQQYYEYVSQGNGEITCTLNPDGNYDIIGIFNVNFPDINVKYSELFDFDINSFLDPGTGRYNFIYRDTAAQSADLTFTLAASQSTYDGTSRYRMGSILTGQRTVFGKDVLPQLPIKKQVIYPTKKLTLDAGNTHIRSRGYPYHLLTYTWQATTRAQLEAIQAAVYGATTNARCIVYEKWLDGAEYTYLCTVINKFDHKVRQGHYQITLNLRELV
jgi:hypothetical protein